MTTGLDLLLAARATPDRDAHAGGQGASGQPSAVERAAQVAALLSDVAPTDAALIRELTRQETARVEGEGSGCGDVLLACCWLPFMVGRVKGTG